MSQEKKPIMTLKELRHVSMRHLMSVDRKELQELLIQADRELFQAQLTRDWLDTAVQFRLWREEEGYEEEGVNNEA